MIGKLLISLGTWFNKHFPEKVSTDEVYGKLAAIELRLHDVTTLENAIKVWGEAVNQQNDQIEAMAKRIETLTSENTALKAATALRSRMTSSIPMPGR